MRRFKSAPPTDDELLARLEEVGHALGIANAELRRVLHRRRARRSVAGFPFNLLERAVRGGLTLLERTVARLVRAVVR
jgi:hypothetical protein